jgi:hypothetical protein
MSSKQEESNGLSSGRPAGRQVAAVGAAAAGAGGALVATAASACCAGPVLAPLVVGLLGASGAAWAAGLKPYSAWILSGAAVMLAFGFFSVYRARPVCTVPAPRARGGQMLVRLLLWVSAALWIAALAVNLMMPS